MKRNYLKITFYSILIIFAFLVTFFAIQSESKNLFHVIGILGLLFLILSRVLIVLARKKKKETKKFPNINWSFGNCTIIIYNSP